MPDEDTQSKIAAHTTRRVQKAELWEMMDGDHRRYWRYVRENVVIGLIGIAIAALLLWLL